MRTLTAIDPAAKPFLPDLSYLDEDPRRTLKRHWDHVRSTLATIDPSLEARGSGPAFQLLGLTEADLRRPQEVVTRRFNLSKSLNIGRQREAMQNGMAPLSALRDKAWGHLFSGWEFAEHRHRQRTIAQRRAACFDLRQRHARGELRLEEYEARMRHLREAWPHDPRNRARPGPGSWWFDALAEERRDV